MRSHAQWHALSLSRAVDDIMQRPQGLSKPRATGKPSLVSFTAISPFQGLILH